MIDCKLVSKLLNDLLVQCVCIFAPNLTPYSPVGREAQTSDLGLVELGVKLHPETGEIIGGHNSDSEQSSVDNIYAIGDILHVSRIYHTRTRNQHYHHRGGTSIWIRPGVRVVAPQRVGY